jgi:biopolymer transport protein ExbB
VNEGFTMQRNRFRSLSLLLCLTAPQWLVAQTPTPNPAAPAPQEKQDKPDFNRAAADFKVQLETAIAELAAVREQIGAEKVPLTQQLRELEVQLLAVRTEYQKTTRLLDSRTLDLGNQRTELEQRREQSSYLSNLLGEYGRNFESRLHITELQRYQAPLEAAKLALENSKLDEDAVFAAETAVVAASLTRVEDVLGGSRFEGKAVDSTGLVKPGAFVLVGPLALFRSADGLEVGAAEQRLGSLEPTVVPFTVPEERDAAAQLVLGTGGSFPVDPTLGNAQKVAGIQETWVEHVLKGGPVMWPIFAMAGAGLIVVLLKWLSMVFIRRPSRKLLGQLMQSAHSGDRAAAIEQSEAIGGPVGTMLRAGAEHLGEPRELIEEAMFEQLLSTRLRLNGWLPFVAICATSAPLLGLLGTVTGIMNTFTLMTVFGTGDPKTLSSGISEALITTEYGLIVAIPSLLLHAVLSRRARGICDEMEKAAVAFLNQTRLADAGPVSPSA